MIDGNEEKKVRNAYPDRFTVDPPGLEKIGRLLGQLRAAVPACEATRKDILGWLIEKAPEELGAIELQELSDRYYDEERFLKLALEEVRAAKARGERLTLDDILQRKAPATAAPARKAPRKRKAIVEVEGGQSAQADAESNHAAAPVVGSD
jgi:hypothetical protein